MPLAQTVQRVQPSVTMAISAKAGALKRQGVDVISLSAGEPDFDTPQHIKDAGIRAIEEGFTKYTIPGSGIIELKEAICDKFRRDNGLEYSIDEVIVNNGAKHSLFLAVAALLDPGDEAIIPTPYWVTYSEQPRLVGAEPVIVETRADNGLKLTAEEFRRAITPRSKMLFLNSPSNPSGSVYTQAELQALAEVAVEHGIYVLSDEIYEKLVYGSTQHDSIAALGPEIKALTLVVNGVSKAYSMTGWRIGYTGGPQELIEGMNKVQSQEVSHPSSMSQKAAVEALNGIQGPVEEMRQAFDQRRRYMTDRLNAIEGVECVLPDGAFYTYPDVSSFYGRRAGDGPIEDSVALCEYLLDQVRVACVPGAGFGTREHMRLSYATSMELIEQAMDRVSEGLARLR
ncbi:MAG: aminotransferase class I/II-fold pyridoxal phosphate-dependent enzyme [Candidatus Latescibacteria bacterium]|nr:aminotransferase class I/II-fold pyridoxal phosphate-dependent enzyme [Candidatus Latescibacterota bacterium]